MYLNRVPDFIPVFRVNKKKRLNNLNNKMMRTVALQKIKQCTKEIKIYTNVNTVYVTHTVY